MQRGVATIELLIAFALATVFITGATLVSFGGQSATLDVVLTGEGMPKAQTYQKTAAAALFSDWDAGPGAASTEGAYTQSRLINPINDCLKFVGSDTDWTSEQERKQNIGFGTLIGSIAKAKAQGGDCPVPPNTEWDNPDSLDSVDVSGADGTGIDARSIGGVRYAFITADPSAAPNPDFIVVDVSDPETIDASDIVAELDTGEGANGVVVAGNYAYILQNKNTEQLQVVDVSNPASPSIITSATRTLPDLNYTCDPESKPCQSGRSIAYYDHKIYIGTRYLFPDGASGDENKEFYIYDVSTPTNPGFAGGLNVNHNVNAIEIADDYAYLATSDDTGELMIVDVSVPSDLEHPDDTGMKFDAKTTSGSASDEDGWSVDVVGQYAYFGRARVSNANERDFYVLNVSDPAEIAIEGSLRFSLATNSYVSGVSKQGNLAFLSTTDSNEPFFVINVSDPSDPKEHSTCGLNFSQVTTGLAYFDGLIFTTNRSNDLLRIIYDQPTLCS